MMPALTVALVLLVAGPSPPTVSLYVGDGADSVIRVTVELGTALPDPDALVARAACAWLRAAHWLSLLPLRYELDVMVPTGGGGWAPDPRRQLRGILRSCP